jgi:hypothetical protein
MEEESQRLLHVSFPSMVSLSSCATTIGHHHHKQRNIESVGMSTLCGSRRKWRYAVPATGYNGSLRGAPPCDDFGHDMENGSCVRTVHGEANAVAQAAKHRIRWVGAENDVTASPCLTCSKLVANCGMWTV